MQRKYLLPILLLIEIIALQVISYFPEFVEQYYSNGLYPKMADFWRIRLGKIPFSIGDCIYGIVIFLGLKWFCKKRKTWRLQWRNNGLQILSFIAVFYFFFQLCWGLNYCRQPLFEKLNIQREYTDAELYAFTKKLIVKTNAIHHQLTANDSVKVAFPYSQKEVFAMNMKGYKNLALTYPIFEYEHLSIKKSLFSLPLTYMGFGGYLNPFTNEAQVNDMGPMYNFPTTTCHEMAHQLGYASESECNFIGFLASIKNDNLYFQYSGYSFALRYCLRNWKYRNEKVCEQLVNTVHPGILANYQESEDFWKEYETFIESGFKIFYDNFLKFNQQKDGLESYSKFVNLMVNYYDGCEL